MEIILDSAITFATWAAGTAAAFMVITIGLTAISAVKKRLR